MLSWLGRSRGNVLFIEYDVTPSGEIELVALINAVEENGEDTDGSAWMALAGGGVRRQRPGMCWGPGRPAGADGGGRRCGGAPRRCRTHRSGRPCRPRKQFRHEHDPIPALSLRADLGNVEAVEHGYSWAACPVPWAQRNVRLGGLSTGRATGRSTTSSAPSGLGPHRR